MVNKRWGGGRTILVEYLLRILEIKQPDDFVFENVSGLLNKKFKMFYESIIDRIKNAGYDLQVKVLDTRSFWIPQRRTRIFLVWSKQNKNFTFPEWKGLEISIEDFFEKQVDEKYYLNDSQIEEAKEKRKGKTFSSGISNGPMKLIRNDLGYILALTKVNFWKTNRQTNLVKDTKGIRILTGQEHEKAQGFPLGWASDILPEYLVKEVMGNAVSIPVVENIFKNLYKDR